MTRRIRVGTRRSRLALAQTGLVLAALGRAAPECRFEPAPTDTSGDRDRSAGAAPDFTDTIDRALARGEVELAVHSAKDLPAELDRTFVLAACPRRDNPRDGLLVGPPHVRGPLPRGARVGSSSPRRRAQLLRWRPDLEVVEIRGNVDTRLRLVRAGQVDAAVLAVAGLARLGRSAEISRILPASTFLPAPGQGALAVVSRSGDSELAEIAGRIDDRATRACVAAERSFAASLGSDCRLPLAALATVRNRAIHLTGEVLSPDGRIRLRHRRVGPSSGPVRLGEQVGQELVKLGALDLMATGRR